MTEDQHPWNCECMKCSWEYTRTGRNHYIDNGERYPDVDGHYGPHSHLWDVASSAPYGFIQEKHGYDLYHKGKLIKHGKTVKELKLIAEGMKQ